MGGGSRVKIGSGSEGLMEGQNWHQLRLHGLEALAGVLAGAERFGQAVGAARAAVDAEPLRESPHAV
jgi:SARP family transcriptional regulator, regulator of embCAB operon